MLPALPLGPRSKLGTVIARGTATALSPAPWILTQGFNKPPPGRCYYRPTTAPWGQRWDFNPPSSGCAAPASCPLGPRTKPLLHLATPGSVPRPASQSHCGETQRPRPWFHRPSVHAHTLDTSDAVSASGPRTPAPLLLFASTTDHSQEGSHWLGLPPMGTAEDPSTLHLPSSQKPCCHSYPQDLGSPGHRIFQQSAPTMTSADRAAWRLCCCAFQE